MERIDYKKLGMEIKIRRLRADISQSKLAKQIGVSQSHLCNVENGRLSPSLRLLLSLRRLLGCKRVGDRECIVCGKCRQSCPTEAISLGCKY